MPVAAPWRRTCDLRECSCNIHETHDRYDRERLTLLTIVESLEPDRVVVKLIGLADSTSSVVLEREFLRLNALRAALVVFDLSQLTFISSLAIGLLVSFRKGQSRHGGKALLEGVTGSVAEALQRTRVTELFV